MHDGERLRTGQRRAPLLVRDRDVAEQPPAGSPFAGRPARDVRRDGPRSPAAAWTPAWCHRRSPGRPPAPRQRTPDLSQVGHGEMPREGTCVKPNFPVGTGSPSCLTAGPAILVGNALTETSSAGSREHWPSTEWSPASREPPEAEKAASRPVRRHSRARGGTATAASGRPMPRRLAPVTGPNEVVPGQPLAAASRRRKCGGTASSLIARTPKGSHTSPGEL